jgi:hypothetical protein
MTTETYAEQRARELQEITPGPWRWKFIGNAGNYFLVGNNGEGPITNSGPNSADGRLMEAAPDLVAALRRIAKEPDNVDEWLSADQMQAIARAALARVDAAGGEA